MIYIGAKAPIFSTICFPLKGYIMFVCYFVDDDGVEFFALGETMCEAFENIQHENGMDIDPDDGSIEFFERVSHCYTVRPRFEKI